MHRPRLLELGMFVPLRLLVLTLCPMSSFAYKQPPNIVIILADDLGWDDVSFHGSAQIPTPNLDNLAADGIILNNYYTHAKCTPSRAALLTGIHPIYTGMQHAVLLGAEPAGLPLELELMPQYLKELGYETHLVGKWHLGYFKKEYTPTYRGFDSFYGFLQSEGNYLNHTFEQGNQTGLDFWNGSEPLWNETGHYATTLFTQRAVNLIMDRNKNKPFFLYLSHQAAHSGSGVLLDAPVKNIAKFPYIGEKNRTIYAGMVDALDESVGTVVEALYEAQMLHNTILVFLTDNGGQPWGAHAPRSFNWPLRGTKHTLWEGGCRAAAFLWSPLVTRRNRVSQQMMHVTDWLPTLYSAAGGRPGRLSRQLDGRDMWRHLSLDKASPRTEVLYNINPIDSTAALRYRNYKLVQGVYLNGTFDDRFRTTGGPRPESDLDRLMATSRVARALRGLYHVETLQFPKDWRQQATLRCGDFGSGSSNFVTGNPPYLFDLEKDPCELKNLASNLPNVVAVLQKKLDSYANSSVPPGNQPIDPRGYPDKNNGVWSPWL